MMEPRWGVLASMILFWAVAACGDSGRSAVSDAQLQDNGSSDQTAVTDLMADQTKEEALEEDLEFPDQAAPDRTSTDTDELPDVVNVEATDSSDSVQPSDMLPDLAPGCCLTSDDCPDGGYCVGGHLDGGGVCHYELMEEGACFVDGDCGTGEVCSGEELCSCTMNCISSAGTCLMYDNCCFVDDHCPDGMVCASNLLGGAAGSCESPLTEPGTCWDVADCPDGQTCENPMICPCDALCDMEDTPGTCVSQMECGQGSVDSEGVGKPCPNGSTDCLGQVANLCSSEVFSDPTLPPICIRYCNGVEPCQDGTFCIDKGWSSSCIPDLCADPFLDSCVSDLECRVATKWDVCCPCGDAYSNARIAFDECLLEGTDANLEAQACMLFCGMPCEMCQPPAAAYCDGSHRCQGAYY